MKYLLFLIISITQIFCANIVVVTATIGDRYKTDTLPGVISKYEYCKKHGYDLYVLDQSLDLSRPLPWSKILIIKELLQTYQYAFWTDADSIIMNQEKKLEDILDFASPADFHICFDNYSGVVNTGQFLIRKSNETFQFLDQVYSCTYAINHGWWENKAIVDLLATGEFEKFVKIYPQRKFNSFGNPNMKNELNIAYQNGDFIIHFPSMKGRDLKFQMNQYGTSLKLKFAQISYNQIMKF